MFFFIFAAISGGLLGRTQMFFHTVVKVFSTFFSRMFRGCFLDWIFVVVVVVEIFSIKYRLNS